MDRETGIERNSEETQFTKNYKELKEVERPDCPRFAERVHRRTHSSP